MMDNFKLLLSKKTIFSTQFCCYNPFHVFNLGEALCKMSKF